MEKMQGSVAATAKQVLRGAAFNKGKCAQFGAKLQIGAVWYMVKRLWSCNRVPSVKSIDDQR
jgi:hypothetical protein